MITNTIHSDAVEAEQALLGRLMVDYEPHEALPSDMIHPAHAAILTAIERISANGMTPDPVTVASAVNDDPAFMEVGGRKYFQKLADAAETSITPMQDLVAVVRGYAARRQAHAIATELAQDALDRTKETPDAISQAVSRLSDVKAGETQTHRSMVTLGSMLLDELSRPLVAYSTGLQSLDEVLEGGLYPGKLYAFDGRMKAGKTVMLGTIARNLAKGDLERHIPPVPTVYIALEMGDREISKRMIAADLGINEVEFKRRTMPDLQERVMRWHDRQRQQPMALTFENKPNLSFERLRPLISRHCRYHGAKVIVLDYWQLVTGQQRGQTEAQHLADIAQWLAGAAKDYDVAIVTAAQRNREGETRGGDGLKMACDVYLQQFKVDPDPASRSYREHVYLEMSESRYTRKQDIGDEENPRLYISNVGPVIEEY